MRGRRWKNRRGIAGTKGLVVALALAWAIAVSALAGDVRGEVGHGRELPPYAVQPPGASFEGYPRIGPRQQVRILREVLAASLGRLVREPVRSASQVSRRMTERLTVRARELSVWAVPTGPHAALPCGSGDLGGTFGGPVLPARLTLLPSSEASVQGLLASIARAERRIDLMIYGWEDDATGREVAAALSARARRGTTVRLLVDRAAFLIHNPAAARNEGTFLDALRAVPNVTVIEPPDPFFQFDHRKLAVFDDRLVWSGGMILTEVARRRWENLAFLAEGPIVASYSRVFEERWREVGGAPATLDLAAAETAPIVSNAVVRMVRTDVRSRSLKETVYHAVDHARHHIYLENPYFSDTLLADRLIAARKRGVDVRVVVTLRGNVAKLNRYVTLTANRLFRGGVRVSLAPTMTHVKAMSIDGVWAYIGTGNFDELSLRNNREVGLSVTSPDVVRTLDQSVFLPHQAQAEALRTLLPTPKHRVLLELMALWY